MQRALLPCMHGQAHGILATSMTASNTHRGLGQRALRELKPAVRRDAMGCPARAEVSNIGAERG